ncbi:Uncharacterised protein [Legionella waltersii]|nr:Uncharacterised protein [Legionella waltersii]
MNNRRGGTHWSPSPVAAKKEHRFYPPPNGHDSDVYDANRTETVRAD